VGGPYIGTARWLGTPLADLLAEAGVHPDADQIVSTSTSGFTIGTPTAVLMDGRDAMLAVGMNGEPLRAEHGFPVRMVVPGLYGYVSATKWVIDIEATTFAKNRPYWVKRGWVAKAPIKTMSRIDTPRPAGSLQAGKLPVAGVAWAQHRGIEKVEVRVDGGPWTQARLAGVPSTDTWVQWVWEWDAEPGEHTLEVRATDRNGDTQTDKRTNPFPSGATGWDARVVTVV
jgi:DMSO/TMAO reductase YedYZ molybdopterin-dependent catalytic subunit